MEEPGWTRPSYPHARRTLTISSSSLTSPLHKQHSTWTVFITYFSLTVVSDIVEKYFTKRSQTYPITCLLNCSEMFKREFCVFVFMKARTWYTTSPTAARDWLPLPSPSNQPNVYLRARSPILVELLSFFAPALTRQKLVELLDKGAKNTVQQTWRKNPTRTHPCTTQRGAVTYPLYPKYQLCKVWIKETSWKTRGPLRCRDGFAWMLFFASRFVRFIDNTFILQRLYKSAFFYDFTTS